jgi:MFS-type transporter involved in bile tolerance (Atg22 family)
MRSTVHGMHFMHGSLFLLVAIMFGLSLSFYDKKGENVWITLIGGVITLINPQNANVFNDPSLWQSKVCYFTSQCVQLFVYVSENR